MLNYKLLDIPAVTGLKHWNVNSVLVELHNRGLLITDSEVVRINKLRANLAQKNRTEYTDRSKHELSRSVLHRALNCGKDLPMYELYFLKNHKLDRTVADSVESGFSRCNNPLCPYCNKSRRSRVYSDMIVLFNSLPVEKLQLITLPFKKVPEISRDYISQCSKQNNRLRKVLKKKGYNIEYGIQVREIKYTKAGEFKFNKQGKKVYQYQETGYNLHYHILYFGDHIPRNELSEAFKEVTGGISFIADSQNVKEYHDMLKVKYQMQRKNTASYGLSYILKYLNKAPEMNDTEVMVNYYQVTKSFRFFQPIGKEFSRFFKEFQENVNPYESEFSFQIIGRHSLEFSLFVEPMLKHPELTLNENMILSAVPMVIT